MADEQQDGSATAGAPKKPSKGPIILAVINTVMVLTALGTLLYTRVFYERPPITEAGERARLARLHQAPSAPAAPGMIHFDRLTLNIRPNPAHPKPADGTKSQIKGKQHYATFTFSLAISDDSERENVEKLRPKILDNLLALMGKKSFDELTTVQGRYLLRTEIAEMVNHQLDHPLVTDVFFSEFIVQ